MTGDAAAADALADSLTLGALAGIVRRHRRRHLVALAASAALVFGGTFLLAPEYSSEVKMSLAYPESPAAPAALGSVAGLLGINLGDTNPLGLYVEFLDSHDFLDEALDMEAPDADGRPVALRRLWRQPGPDTPRERDRLVQRLRRSITYRVNDKIDVITIRARTGSPELSRAVAQNLIVGINRFHSQRGNWYAGKKAEYFAAQLEVAEARLRAHEDSLVRFQERNAVIKSPSLRMQLDRRQRELDVQSAIVRELRTQQEMNVLSQRESLPALSLVQSATFPCEPVWPRRLPLTLLGVIVCQVALAYWQILRNWRGRVRE